MRYRQQSRRAGRYFGAARVRGSVGQDEGCGSASRELNGRLCVAMRGKSLHIYFGNRQLIWDVISVFNGRSLGQPLRE